MRTARFVLLFVPLFGCETAVECADVCGAPNVCVDGLCVAPEVDGGGVDAGSRDAGSRDAGGRDAPETDGGQRDAATSVDVGPDTSVADSGPPDAGPVCDDSVFPPGLRHIARAYTELGPMRAFGESTHGARLVEFGEGQFVTFAFRTPDTPFRRRLVFVDPPTSHNMPDIDNLVTLTLSPCPGDFGVTGRCRLENWNGTVRISTLPGDVGDENYCVLEAGRDYFMNFVSTAAPYERAPTCSDAEPYDSRRCAMFFSEAVLGS